MINELEYAKHSIVHFYNRCHKIIILNSIQLYSRMCKANHSAIPMLIYLYYIFNFICIFLNGDQKKSIILHVCSTLTMAIHIHSYREPFVNSIINNEKNFQWKMNVGVIFYSVFLYLKNTLNGFNQAKIDLLHHFKWTHPYYLNYYVPATNTTKFGVIYNGFRYRYRYRYKSRRPSMRFIWMLHSSTAFRLNVEEKKSIRKIIFILFCGPHYCAVKLFR